MNEKKTTTTKIEDAVWLCADVYGEKVFIVTGFLPFLERIEIIVLKNDVISK